MNGIEPKTLGSFDSRNRVVALLPWSFFALAFIAVTHWGRIKGNVYYQTFQLPLADPVGLDFRTVYKSAATIAKGLEGYRDIPTNVYPPGVSLLYFPLTFLDEKLAYVVLSSLLLVALAVGISLCRALSGPSRTTVEQGLFGLAAAAVFYHTYPVQFALERGNYDIPAITATLAGIYALIHGRSAVGGFCLAIGCILKIYPILCLAIFVRRFNVRFLATLTVTGLGGLFCFGETGVVHFYRSLRHFNANPYFWQGNHSLASYINWVELPPVYATVGVVALLFTFISGCVLLWKSFDRLSTTSRVTDGFARILGAEQYLLGIAFTLMALVTSSSHDYKLVIQLFPFVLCAAFLELPAASSVVRSLLVSAAGVALAFVMSPVTFFPKTPFIGALFAAYLGLFIHTVVRSSSLLSKKVDEPEGFALAA